MSVYICGCQKPISRVFLNHFSCFFLRQGLWVEFGAHQSSWTSWPASPKDPSVPAYQSLDHKMPTSIPSFYVGTSAPNSGPCDCMAKYFTPWVIRPALSPYLLNNILLVQYNGTYMSGQVTNSKYSWGWSRTRSNERWEVCGMAAIEMGLNSRRKE